MNGGMHGERSASPIVLDCNAWIAMLHGNERLNARIVDGGTPVVLTSYIAVEILRALRHVARRCKVPISALERRFWATCLLDSIEKQFKHPLSDGVIDEIKSTAEMTIIARLLDLEIKDVPYIVAAFQNKAILVTDDVRSIIARRDAIKTTLGITTLTVIEFLDS